MARPRLHATPAERQRAYRERVASLQAAHNSNSPHPEGKVTTRQVGKKARPASRPSRLAESIRPLQALLAEYERWRERLPDFQEGSEQEARVTETIDSLEQAIELLTDIQLPRGYGKD